MPDQIPDEVRQQLEIENEEALLADGFEAALIGICYRFGQPSLACYDYERCLKRLIERDGMTREEAVEFFDFNVIGAGMGENSPVFVKLFT